MTRARGAAVTSTPIRRRPSSFSVVGLTMYVGEPPELQVIPVGGVIHVAAGTPVQAVNDGDEDLVLYGYGSPPDEGAEVLPPAA